MAFDYKKEYREFYMPQNKSGIVTVPPMNYIAVRGQGNPNRKDGRRGQRVSTILTKKSSSGFLRSACLITVLMHGLGRIARRRTA